jgi:small Trp-rich protein
MGAVVLAKIPVREPRAGATVRTEVRRWVSIETNKGMGMWFVGLGLLQIVLHLAGIGAMGSWNWDFTGDLWKFAWPFAAAVAWWTWADKSGYSKRREVEAIEKRKEDRRAENLSALGLSSKRRDRKR